MEQLYTMRHLLELEAIRTITWPEPEALADLQARADEIESGVVAGRPDVAMQALVEFFLDIYRLCPRKLIVAEIERLWMRTSSYRSLNYDVMSAPQGSTLRFGQVIDALATHDRERLANLLQRPTLHGLTRARGETAVAGPAERVAPTP